jgi:hypothetical protein
LIGDALSHDASDRVAANAHEAVVEINIVESGVARIVEAIEDELANGGGGFEPARFLGGASYLARDGGQRDTAAVYGGGKIGREVRESVVRRTEARILPRTLTRLTKEARAVIVAGVVAVGLL